MSTLNSIDSLKRKIRELQFENEKLRLHVDQAEKSIQSYRGFLSNKPQSARSRDVECQTLTMPPSSLPSCSSAIGQVEFNKLQCERDDLKVAVEMMSCTLKKREAKWMSREEELMTTISRLQFQSSVRTTSVDSSCNTEELIETVPARTIISSTKPNIVALERLQNTK